MGTKYSWKKSDPIKACQFMSKTIKKIWGHSLLMTQFANNLDVLKKIQHTGDNEFFNVR